MGPQLSYTALFVLQALARGHRFGFEIMDATGRPSGTVYPALRRLEALGFVESGGSRTTAPGARTGRAAATTA